MLELSSERWKELRHAYGPADNIPGLLNQLSTAPASTWGDSELWHSLWSALCHQHDVYTASYAAVPHLAAQAASRPPDERIPFVQLIAWIEVCRHRRTAALVPVDLEGDYYRALDLAADSVLECFSLRWDDLEYRVLLGGLAVFQGKPELGARIVDPPEEVECPECHALVPIPGHEIFEGATGPN